MKTSLPENRQTADIAAKKPRKRPPDARTAPDNPIRPKSRRSRTR